jgi:alkyl hydroperoxide reductase subunit AhpC
MCRTQLAELDRRLDELSARGVDVIAISAETRERSEQLQADWKRLDDLLHGIDYWTKVGYPARGDG